MYLYMYMYPLFSFWKNKRDGFRHTVCHSSLYMNTKKENSQNIMAIFVELSGYYISIDPKNVFCCTEVCHCNSIFNND